MFLISLEFGAIVNETNYKAWWQLHLRVSQGEQLNDEQQNIYDEGLRSLEASEALPSINETRSLRDQLKQLQTQNTKLESDRLQLESEIRQLEQALSQQTRQLLGIEE